MQRFFILIALLVGIGGGVVLYVEKPEFFGRTISTVTEKVKNWEPDPEDPPVAIPEGWAREQVVTLANTYLKIIKIIPIPDMTPLTPNISW